MGTFPTWREHCDARDAAFIAQSAAQREAQRIAARAEQHASGAPTADEIDGAWDGTLRGIAPELFAPTISQWWQDRSDTEVVWQERDANGMRRAVCAVAVSDGRGHIVRYAIEPRYELHRFLFPAAYVRTVESRPLSAAIEQVTTGPRPTLAERRAATQRNLATECSLATHGQILNSADSRYDTATAATISRADELLAEFGQSLRPVDLWDRKYGRFTVSPDRVAHRGTARYVVPTGVLAERTVTERTAIGRDGQSAAATFLTYLTTTTERFGFIGHRAVVVKRNRAATRKATSETTQAARKARGATGKRGPAVSPWSMSARSLLAAVKRDAQSAAAADTTEAILCTSAMGAVLKLTTGETITVMDGATVRVGDGAVMTYRDAARRAALAGAAIAD